MIWDVFLSGRFICHFPMYGFQVEEFLREVEDHLTVLVTQDEYSARIELL